MVAVELTRVSHRYGSRLALDRVTFAVPCGALFGLLGANGAGKTTCLNLITTLLPPSEGAVRVAGWDAVAERVEVSRRVGYAPEEPKLYTGLTPAEHVELAARLHGMSVSDARRATGEVLERLGLADRADDAIATFSKGMRRKALLAAALVHDPELLVLDEPLEGLDVFAQAALATAPARCSTHSGAPRVRAAMNPLADPVPASAAAATALPAEPVVTRGLGWLARPTRAPRDELALPNEALRRDHARRRALRADALGIPPQALALPLGIYLFATGLALAVEALELRAAPGVAAMAVGAVALAVAFAVTLPDALTSVLGDENHGVIAAWPTSPAAYLLARVHGLGPRAAACAALVTGPSALVLCGAGTPVVTALAFITAAVTACAALAWTLAGSLAAAARIAGVGTLRRLAAPLQLAGGAAPLALIVAAEVGALPVAALAELSPWLPLAWLGAWVELSAGAHTPGVVAGAALLCVTVVVAPVLALRLGATGLALGLASPQALAVRAVGRRPVARVVAWLGRRRAPAGAAVSALVLAHLRADWRFRAAALSVPLAGAAAALALGLGAPVLALFADPFAARGALHPAMVIVVGALIPPIIAAPALARSVDAGAAWTLIVSPADELAFADSGRRLVRQLFVGPYLVAVAVGYAAAGLGPFAIARVVLVLALLAELALLALQRRLPRLPFSCDYDDEEVAQVVTLAVILAYISAGLVAFAVVHVVFRWPAAWVATLAWLLALRTSLARAGGARPPELTR